MRCAAVKMNEENLYWKKKILQDRVLSEKVRYRTVYRVYWFCIKIRDNNIYVYKRNTGRIIHKKLTNNSGYLWQEE